MDVRITKNKVLNARCLENSFQTEMSCICSRSFTKLKLFVTITAFLRFGKLRGLVIWGVVTERLAVLLHEKTFVNRFAKWIHAAEWKIFAFQYHPIPIIIVYFVKSETGENNLRSCKEPRRDRALVVKPDKLVSKTAMVHGEADSRFRLALKRYKVEHDCPVRFARILWESYIVYLNSRSLFVQPSRNPLERDTTKY